MKVVKTSIFLCLLFIIVNTIISPIYGTTIEETRPAQEGNRGTTYPRDVPALQNKNYTVYLKWEFRIISKIGDHRANPWFKIIIQKQDGSQSVHSLATGTGSYAGTLPIPAYSSRITVQANVGETRSLHHLVNWHYYGYGYYYKLTYMLDEAPPNQPDTPWITSCTNGGFNKIGNKFFTNSSSFSIQWNPVTDNGTLFDGYLLKSETKDYLIYIDNSPYPLDVNGNAVWTSNVQGYISGLSQGEHTIQIQARDNENNVSNTGPPVTVVIDLAFSDRPGAPEATPISPYNPLYTNASSVTWSWDPVTDSSGIREYKVSIDNGATWESIDTATSYSHNVVDGRTYQCMVKAIDMVGNESEPSNVTELRVDQTVPQVSLPAYSIQLVGGDAANTAVFCWDPITTDFSGVTKYEVALTQTTDEPTAGIVLVTSPLENNKWLQAFGGLSSENQYYAWVRGIDNVGNTGPWTRTGPFPEFSLTGPENDTYINTNSPTFQVSSTGGKELKFRVGYEKSGDNSTKTYSPLSTGTASISITEGLWDWWLEVFEVQNGEIVNESKQVSETFHFTVDTTAPGGSLRALINPTNNPNITLEININDDLGSPDTQSEVQGIYLWNGTETTPPAAAQYINIDDMSSNTLPWQLASGQDGERTVSMQVVDNAGNTSLVTYLVKLDTTAPEKPYIYDHITAADNITFKWRVANSGNDLSYFTGSYTLPDGTIVAIDPAMIAQTYEENRVDAYLTIPVNSSWANQPVTLTVRSVDLAGNPSDEATSTIYTQASPGDLQNLANEPGCQEHKLIWGLVRVNPDPTVEYKLEYWAPTNNTEVPTAAVSPVNDQFTVSNLLAHKFYRYRLVSINRSGDRNEGLIKTRRVANIEPIKPALTFPTANTYAGMTVKFKFARSTDADMVDQLEYYLHYWKEGENPTQATVLGPITGDEAADSLLTVTLTDNTAYYWYVKVKDSFKDDTGIWEYFDFVQSEIRRFTVDGTAPVITVKRPDGIYTNQEQLTVKVSDVLSGVKEVAYQRISDMGEILYTGQVNLSFDTIGNATGVIELPEGSYNLKITAKDNAENQLDIDLNNLKVDHTKPILSNIRLELEQNERYFYLSDKGEAEAGWTATDQTGIKGLQYWLLDQNGEQFGQTGFIALSPKLENYSYPLDLPGANGKVYTLVMAVLDLAGNRSDIQYPGRILIDRTPPEIQMTVTGFTSYGTNYYTSSLGNLTATATATDQETACTTPVFAIISSGGAPVTPWGLWNSLQGIVLESGEKYRIIGRTINEVGTATEVQGEEFIYDKTAPHDGNLSGPNGPLVSGEQVIFTATAIEDKSPIAEYRLAIGTSSGTKELTTLIPGNVNGWLVVRPNSSPAQFKFELPPIADGTYYPTLEVINAVGLSKTINGKNFTINNTNERIIVSDQGPYTLFNDRLTGWWRYIGPKTVTGYTYQIIKQADQSVVREGSTTETAISITGLQLEDGRQYAFKVLLKDNPEISGASLGITVDTTVPEITSLKTPAYATSKNIHIEWAGRDEESRISKVQVALGSDYYLTDVTGGWVDVTGASFGLSCKADGTKLDLQTGKRYYITFRLTNGAGLITEKIAPGMMIDDTPPLEPVVIDQGAYINLTQPLEANWIWSPVDPESNCTYQWALVESKDDISANTPWHDGNETMRVSVSAADYPRVHGRTYYFAVKATNSAGLTSIGFSNGIMTDATAPIIPKVTLLQAVNLGQEKSEVTYITNTNDLQLWIDSLDPESDINRYEYAYGTWENVDTAQEYESQEPKIDQIQLQINEEEIAIFKGECFNEAELKSQTGYSSGVKLDTGAPEITDVHGAIAGEWMVFDWGVNLSSSPVAWYEVALVKDEAVNSDPGTWNKIGLDRSYMIDGKTLQDGNYRLLIRGCNQAGTYSRRAGNLNEWGVSPRITLDRHAPVMKEEQFKYAGYAADQLRVEVGADDNTPGNPSIEGCGISGYQYALGNRDNLFEYTRGWVGVNKKENWIEFDIPTTAIPHHAAVYLMIRAKDNVGLWAEPLVSDMIISDHTLPTQPKLNTSSYTTSKVEIAGIGYISEDPESKLTNYRLGVVAVKGEPWLFTQEGKMADFNNKLNGITLEEAKVYYVAMQTMNGAGKWSEIGYSEAITVDTIAPEISFTKGDRVIVINPITGDDPPLNIGYWLSEAAEVSFMQTADDGGSKIIGLSGVAGDNNSYPFKESKPQIYTIYATPKDLAKLNGEEADPPQKIRVNATPQIIATDEVSTTPGAELIITVTLKDNDREAGDILTYTWDPGDGTANIGGSTSNWVIEDGQSIIKIPLSHKYYFKTLFDSQVTYNATLTITDKDGGKTTKMIVINVGNTTKGELCIDETWSGTHHLYGDVTVPAGITLTILPGTQIIIDGNPQSGYNYALIVRGNLVTENSGQAINFSSATGKVSGWKGIYLEGEATLNNVIIRHALRGVTVVGTANATINYCTFELNQVGIHVYGAKPTIFNTSFLDNSWFGIKEDADGTPIVVNCRFSGNGIDYYHQQMTKITLEKLNQIEGNSGNRQ